MKTKQTKYNVTQLTPQKEFEKHVYHRDQFAHYFRWSHVLKNARIGQKVLDMGCGSGEMLELFYRNRYRPELYTGLDIRDTVDEKLKKLDFADIRQMDLCKPFELDEKYDIATSFEVVEHIGHNNIDPYLDNIKRHLKDDGRVYLSTPNYDPQVGAAKNHIIDGEIGEWDFYDLKEKLNEHFNILETYGTFASQKDYKKELTGWRKEAFEELNKYYDSNMVSVIMAPMIPADQARNVLWVLGKKGENNDQ